MLSYNSEPAYKKKLLKTKIKSHGDKKKVL